MSKFTTLLLLFITLLTSCKEEDEPCAENGRLNNDCFNVVATYNVQTYGADRDTRENLFLEYQWPDNGTERLTITIRSDEFPNNPASNGQVDAFWFETGTSYISDKLTTNTVGEFSAEFTKVDRENGLVSGSFTWKGSDTDVTTGSNFNGTFTDVAVNLESR